MEGSDTLYSLAEVSATFVGLSLVVGVLSGRDDTVEIRLKRVYLRSFAFIGLSVVAGCFAPVVLFHYQMTEANIWRLSSLLFFCLWVGGLLSNLSFIETRQTVKKHPFSFALNLLFVFGGWGLLCWNIYDPGIYALGMYVSAMMFALVLGARFFYTSTFSVEEPDT